MFTIKIGYCILFNLHIFKNIPEKKTGYIFWKFHVNQWLYLVETNQTFNLQENW
jgi:hypothetical protein